MNKKNIVLVFASIILIGGMLAGCAKPTPTTVPTAAPLATSIPTAEPTANPTPTPIVVTDALGRTVEFATLPQRIVLAGKATFMITNAFFLFPEAIDRVVGFENRLQTSNNFIKTAFPAADSITLLEKNAGAEQIAPLNPDLVVMKTYMQKSLGDPLEAIGIKVVYLDLETPDKFYADLRTIGQILGNSTRAEELVTRYQTSDAAVKNAVSGIAETGKPSVLMLEYVKDGDNVAFAVPPVDWLQTTLVENAGGNPVWKDTVTDGGWTVVTLEQIAVWNPDIIIIVDYKGNGVSIVQGLKTDAKWASLDSVKNGKIYAFPLDFQTWDQPDSRWILGEYWLATKIQPDLFKSINMTDEITNFYKNYYGLDDATITGKILPLVKGDL